MTPQTLIRRLKARASLDLSNALLVTVRFDDAQCGKAEREANAMLAPHLDRPADALFDALSEALLIEPLKRFCAETYDRPILIRLAHVEATLKLLPEEATAFKLRFADDYDVRVWS